jgi:fido (protein-threonine AMPylation protein)
VVFTELSDPAALRDRPMPEVVDVLARTYAGVNMLHPSSKAMGAAQPIFLDQVAAAAGCRIHWSRIADRQNEVMAEAYGVRGRSARRWPDVWRGCREM